MRNTLIILLLALICTTGLARHSFGQNRRHFRPSENDSPDNYDDPNGNDYGDNGDDRYDNGDDRYDDGNDGYDNGNDGYDNGENSWNDGNSNDEPSWRDDRSNRQHKSHHSRGEAENNNNQKADNSNNKETHARSSNVESNTENSGSQSSNTQSSNTQSSNIQSSTSGSSTSGHLASDTFASTDYNGDAKFKQQCLDVHNDERATLGIDPVTYNDDLAAAAKAWAEQLVQSGELSHSPNRVHVGENVGYRSHRDNVDATPLIIGSWIAEKQYFENGNYPDISTTGSPHDVGHYSQVIWATTKEIGCAVVEGDDRDYMCCQYAPSGNRQGEPVY